MSLRTKVKIDDLWNGSATPTGYSLSSDATKDTYKLQRAGNKWRFSAPYGGVSFGVTISIKFGTETLSGRGTWAGTQRSSEDDDNGEPLYERCTATATVEGRRPSRD